MTRWYARWVELSQRNERIAGAAFALRAGLASMAAVTVTHFFHLGEGIFAMIAAVIVSDAPPEVLRRLGFFRLAGTAFGAIVGGVVAVLCGHATWAVGLGVFVTILIGQLAGFKDATKVGGYIAGLIILNYTVKPWTYASDRLLETVVGIVCAILVSLLLPVAEPPAKSATGVK